jgi:hypothetical protein
VEIGFTESDPHAAARLTEEVLGLGGGDGLAILAPHGGMIERHTDEQARSVYETLALKGKPVRAWIARGFNAGSAGAHTCWHITSSEISEHSFPLLRTFFALSRPHGQFAHVIAFQWPRRIRGRCRRWAASRRRTHATQDGARLEDPRGAQRGDR